MDTMPIDWEATLGTEGSGYPESLDLHSAGATVVDGGLEVRRHKKKQRFARKRRERATAWRARER